MEGKGKQLLEKKEKRKEFEPFRLELVAQIYFGCMYWFSFFGDVAFSLFCVWCV